MKQNLQELGRQYQHQRAGAHGWVTYGNLKLLITMSFNNCTWPTQVSLNSTSLNFSAYFDGHESNISDVDVSNLTCGDEISQENIGALPGFFMVPQIPGWLSSLYLSMLCLSIIIGVPGNTLTVAAYARIRVRGLDSSDCVSVVLCPRTPGLE
ncbi:hypothetical protein PoB_000318800 [Plakobranchus ocellatus]|uniref:G-protein coupled receptors family 1 profile domain-containing protein n=1 Tax=Plakobranchus ocellatus TaxID=259542 RepID=A0AAV3Y216_9GAST|nr:hypothetical protein PoB_000318800 [Plakobranchus ocellatus]